MSQNSQPFSVREGFAPRSLGMDNPEVLHKIWAAIYGLISYEDALRVLQEVFAFSVSAIHKARKIPEEIDAARIPDIIRESGPENRKWSIGQEEKFKAKEKASFLDSARESVEEKWTDARDKGEWPKFYEMCEFLIASGSRGWEIDAKIRETLDKMGNAGCRLVDGQFARGLSREEAEEIEMSFSGPFPEARTHMKNAVAAYANRERPDYAHVVKESVSAVESLVKELTGKEEVRSGLSQLAKDGILPQDRGPKGDPYLVQALDGYWGYANKTSRHGLKSGESPPDPDTARFLLVTCAAFVNYITARTDNGK